jgi:GalNAc-alpha-(1->4)-GalNAc-alpha-(1->3)-diNAcBac-PP-undecaprenol alpha-1,4-N-acetyl-D-galactosaminyltransferase
VRILINVGSLRAGGAERVVTLLARGFTDLEHRVTVATWADPVTDFFTLPDAVDRISLGLEGDTGSFAGKMWSNVRRVAALRRALARVNPHVVISFVTEMNVLTALAAVGRHTTLVLSERTDPVKHETPAIWRLLRALIYRTADLVVAQTSATAAWLTANVPGLGRVAILPNPVVVADTDPAEAAVRVLASRVVFAAGRLDRGKRFDVLINAFAQIANDLPGFRLVIAGAGPESSALATQVEQLGIGDRVLLAGRVSDTASLYRGARVVALTSDYEGFPNVVLEALSWGVPVVATDCSQGLHCLLEERCAGLLVERDNVAQVAAALRQIAADDELAKRFSAGALEAVKPYALPNATACWMAEILSVARDG